MCVRIRWESEGAVMGRHSWPGSPVSNAVGQHGPTCRGLGGGMGGEVQEGWGSPLEPLVPGPGVRHRARPGHPPTRRSLPTLRPRPGGRPDAPPAPGRESRPWLHGVTPVPVRYSPRVTRAEESSLNSEKDVFLFLLFPLPRDLQSPQRAVGKAGGFRCGAGGQGSDWCHLGRFIVP